MPTVKPLKPRNNREILTAIRNQATPSYRQNVPDVTQASIKATLENIWNYVPARNEFLDALINQIGRTTFHRRQWLNPMAIFKQGPLAFGSTIQEVAVGFAKAHVYDPDRSYLESDIFGQHANEVMSAYHPINRQEYFPVTVNEMLIKRAFTSESDTALWDLAAALIASAANADAQNEFDTTCALFQQYYDNGGFFKVNVANMTEKGLTQDERKARAADFLVEVRAMVDTLPFVSRAYNAAHMPMFASVDELVLFVTARAKASIDVDAYAAAFNMDRTDALARIIVIPDDKFPPGAQAILTTDEFFIISDTLVTTTTAANPVGLYSNYFLHHQSIISASPFVPAILFTTEAGTDINAFDPPVDAVADITLVTASGVTVTDSKVDRGTAYVVFSEASTNPDGGGRTAIQWTLEGKTSARTYLSQSGVLSVAIDEEADTLKVTATSVDDDTFAKSITVTVVGEGFSGTWPLSIINDADRDGTPEVTPKAIVKDEDTDKVTIPNVPGVQYSKTGTGPVANGSVHDITGATTFTAAARAGSELAPGAVTTWTVS